MRFHVLTLFPEMIQDAMHTSILGRAMENKQIELNTVNIRDFTKDKHGKVDDYTYGGGAGMLMQAQPVYDAWQFVNPEKKIRTVYVTPQGTPFCQKLAEEYAKEEELIILCGHYEGIDERVLEETVTDYVSIGDYVLTGGELPALVMIDAVSRLVQGVLNNEESAQTESFHNHLLEYPQYSRPEVWHDKKVPDVLLSGNHKKIEAWRLEASVEKTKAIRPDLYEKYQYAQKILKQLNKQKKENAYLIDNLQRGVADIVGVEKEAVLAYNRDRKVWMLCADQAEHAKKLLSYIPEDAHLMIHNCAKLNEALSEQFGFQVYGECYQSVYTQKTAMPVAHKDIRLLTMKELPYLEANYGNGDSGEYLAERIKKKEMFGAYVDDKLCGFTGMHGEGSLGILFVDPAYRRYHIGSSLTSYVINKALERGGLPYGHIITTNEASMKMQESMGLYVAKKNIFWVGK